MTAHDAVRVRRVDFRRHPVDDAYIAWLDAHSRCTDALRAWQAAALPAHTATYCSYLAELGLEEAAARELQQLHSRVAAGSMAA